MKLTFEALELDLEGLKEPDPNNFAFFYSGAFEKIFNHKKKESPTKLRSEGYVCVSSDTHRIYLRYKALPPVKLGNVMLTYENLCKLGAVTGKNMQPAEVSVSPCSWWWYLWNNSDIVRRLAFRMAFFGVIVSIASIVLSIVSLC